MLTAVANAPPPLSVSAIDAENEARPHASRMRLALYPEETLERVDVQARRAYVLNSSARFNSRRYGKTEAVTQARSPCTPSARKARRLADAILRHTASLSSRPPDLHESGSPVPEWRCLRVRVWARAIKAHRQTQYCLLQRAYVGLLLVGQMIHNFLWPLANPSNGHDILRLGLSYIAIAYPHAQRNK